MLTTENQIQYLNPSPEFETSTNPAKIDIIGSCITALPFEIQINLILEWAINKLSKVICVSNTHMLVEAYWHPEFSSVLKSADIVTPDGMPLVWMLKLMGAGTQNRVAGMDILLSLCKLAPLRDIHLFFLGADVVTLEIEKIRNKYNYPNLYVVSFKANLK